MNTKQIAAFAVGPIGVAALGFVTLPFITWFYSVEDIGRIAMLRVVSSFCILLFSLGLDQAYVREYHEAEHKPALLKAALLPGFLLLTLVLVLCFVVPDLISKTLFAVDSIQISLLAALCFITAFISRFLSLILRMQEKGLAFSMSQVLPRLLFLLIIGVYVLFSYGFDFFHLVIAQTVSTVAVTLVYGWNTRKEWLTALKQKIDPKKLTVMLHFGAPLILGGVTFWGLTVMDRLFLRSLSTFKELGIYSVASSFAAAAIIFQGIFSTVWAPTVYKWVATGKNLEKVDQITEYVLAAVAILFSMAGLFSWIIPYFLPASYKYIQYILVSCMAYPLFYTLSETTVIGIEIVRKTVYAMAVSIIAVVVNFIGNYLLVPSYGAAGAAVSTAMAFWVFLFLRTEFSSRLWRTMPRIKLYSVTLICLILSVLFTMKGKAYHFYFIFLWAALLMVTLAIFKNAVMSLLLFILGPIRSRHA